MNLVLARSHSSLLLEWRPRAERLYCVYVTRVSLARTGRSIEFPQWRWRWMRTNGLFIRVKGFFVHSHESTIGAFAYIYQTNSYYTDQWCTFSQTLAPRLRPNNHPRLHLTWLFVALTLKGMKKIPHINMSLDVRIQQQKNCSVNSG